MRRRTAPLFAVLLAAASMAWLPATSVAASAAPVAIVSGESSDAEVGDTLGLVGIDDDEALDVTLTKVVDPARTRPYADPDPGKHYVAVQFRLKNTGTAVYKDSPSNGATVIDKLGQRFGSAIFDSAAGPEFPGSITIRPGGSALGFISFEVPDGTRISTVQFAMNSGFSDDVGQWDVTHRNRSS